MRELRDISNLGGIKIHKSTRKLDPRAGQGKSRVKNRLLKHKKIKNGGFRDKTQNR